MSQEHPGTLDFDDGDMVLGGYGFDGAIVGLVVNERAGGRRLHGIEETYGDVGIFGRLNAGGVQDFGSEVGQFGRLFKVQMPYGLRIFHHARVVVVHPVDIGPDLDFLRADGGSHQGGGVVAAAPLEVVHLVMGIAADVALGNIYIGLGGHQRLQMPADEFLVRLSLGVQFHEIQGGNQEHVHALFLQVQFHHLGGEQFSLSQDYFFLRLSEQFPCKGR